MCKPAIVKEHKKNAKKLTMKNDQKYEILQNSKIVHTQSKLQGEIFKLAKFYNKRIILKSSKQIGFFILIGKGPNLSKITPNF